MYGEIFTGHLSKYSKCFRRRTVCEKNERQNCRSVLYRKVFCNEALRKNAAFQCAKRFAEDSAARKVLSGYSGRISGYKNSPVLKNPGLWKKSLQKNVFFYPITTNSLTDAKERSGFRTPRPSATGREACKSKGKEW